MGAPLPLNPNPRRLERPGFQSEVAAMVSLTDPEKLDALLRVRCTALDLARWQKVADGYEVTLSALVRDLLDGLPPKARRQTPRVDPQLAREVAIVGGNMNQIAKAMNVARMKGVHVAAIDILAQLSIIERQLRQLIEEAGPR